MDLGGPRGLERIPKSLGVGVVLSLVGCGVAFRTGVCSAMGFVSSLVVEVTLSEDLLAGCEGWNSKLRSDVVETTGRGVVGTVSTRLESGIAGRGTVDVDADAGAGAVRTGFGFESGGLNGGGAGLVVAVEDAAFSFGSSSSSTPARSFFAASRAAEDGCINFMPDPGSLDGRTNPTTVGTGPAAGRNHES